MHQSRLSLNFSSLTKAVSVYAAANPPPLIGQSRPKSVSFGSRLLPRLRLARGWLFEIGRQLFESLSLVFFWEKCLWFSDYRRDLALLAERLCRYCIGAMGILNWKKKIPRNQFNNHRRKRIQRSSIKSA
ncbi:hypothetical protein KM043_001069 [Ampulex compressa]|nr:hypothetical protein KM043_001069 [Ampulex compressa]